MGDHFRDDNGGAWRRRLVATNPHAIGYNSVFGWSKSHRLPHEVTCLFDMGGVQLDG